MTYPSLALLLFAASNSPKGSGGGFVLFIFFCLGVLLFIFGFRKYREYRILEDTPLAPIRSIPMGLVHIRGKVTGENRLSSPLTRTPCYYYQVRVEKWMKKDKSEGWEQVREDTDMCPFIIDDTTGKVQVNPTRAEFDVPRTFQGGLGPRGRGTRFLEPTLGVPAPTEQNLLDYLGQTPAKLEQALGSIPPGAAALVGKLIKTEQKLESMGVSISAGGISVGTANHSYRFTEHCLIAEREHNITGTCVENPAPHDEHDRNLIQKGQNEPTFLISSRSEKELEKSVWRQAALLILIGAAMMIGIAAIVLGKLGLFK